jgi:hypothetical protein
VGALRVMNNPSAQPPLQPSPEVPEEGESKSAKIAPSLDDQITGLPLLHTWCAVYIVVAIIFVVWVLLLSALQRMYS